MDFTILDPLELASWVAAALQLALVIGVILRVMLTRHPPGSSFAWILITVLVPYVGFILYLLLGEKSLGRWHSRNIRREMRRRRQQFRHIPLGDDYAPLHHRGLCRLASRLGKYPLTRESSLHLMSDPAEIMTRIITDIDAAKEQILMEFYIWDLGGRADDVSAALVRAAKRGVQCFVLVDDIGSAQFLKSNWVNIFQQAGIVLQCALEVSFFSALFARADIRLHRKIIVIDHEIGYSGSMNVADPLFFKRDENVGQWVDAMVRAKGEIVKSLHHLFTFDWNVNNDKNPIPPYKFNKPPYDASDRANVMLVPSGPGTSTDANMRIMLEAIYQAKKSIHIVTPYFVPSEALVLALQNAAVRGVDVQLIIPEKSDSKLVTYASHRYFDDLLQAGVRIFFFQNGVLHTKSLLVDNEISLFGTVNMDMRSMHINYELMLLVLDKEFCTKINKMHDDYRMQSRPISLVRWYHRPLLVRMKEGASYLLSPLL